MVLEEPVGRPPAERVEFDALDDRAAVCARADFRRVEEVGLEDLELDREREPVLRPADAPAYQDLTVHGHRARDELLEAVEIEPPVGIARGRLGPRLPPGRRLRRRGRLLLRRGGNPPADRVIDDRMERGAGPGVVTDQVARLLAEPREAGPSRGVRVGARGPVPALGPAAD